MGRSRYTIILPDQPHFITCTVLNWLPVFTRSDTVQIVLDSLAFLQGEGLKIYGWVILENHLHLVVQSDDLSKDLARFKSFTARKVIDYLQEHGVHTLLDQLAYHKKAHKKDSQYQLWQEGVHAELIQGEEMMRQKVDYIHHNPVKRGYVDLAEHWRYSSGRNYSGEEGLLDVCVEW